MDSSSLGPVDSIPESSPLPAKPSRSADNTKLPLKKSATDPIPVELQNLQQYQVLKRIGRGGMGDVFLVKHKLTGRQEVLKVIHGQLLDRNDVRDRFKREIQSAAKLDHPNVVHTLSAIEEGGLLGLVMEYVPGESLAELVKRTGPLPIDTARDFIRQAACGLAHAFQHQMVHRDIKPQNLHVSKENDILRLRILDFGLAKTTGAIAADSDLTIDGSILGTPHFMSPEQALSPASADIRSDIYSLGCTWFFLLSGKPPFEGDGPLAVLNAHQNRPVPDAASLRSSIPLETVQILKKMMAKLPKDRYQTPDELLRSMIAPRQNSPKNDLVSKGSAVAALDANLLFQPPHSAKPNSETNASELFDFAPKASVLPTRKKANRGSNSSLVVSILLPTVLLIGTMILRPEWLSEIRSVIMSDGRKTSGPLIGVLNPGQSRIVLNNLPKNVQIFLDGAPAKFEESRKGASPSILTQPGNHILLVRRQGKNILKEAIELADRHELTVELSFPETERSSTARIAEATKSNDFKEETRVPGHATPSAPSADLGDTNFGPDVPNELQLASDPVDVLDQTKGDIQSNSSEVIRNKFSVQQRLVAHSSPVFRLDFLFDGRLASSERKGQLIRVKGQNTEVMNNIFIWSKNGDRQPLPDSTTFADFVGAQNGKYRCHAGVDARFMLFRLFSEGKIIWQVNISNEEAMEYGSPIMSFSDDSDEFLIATRRGMFQKYNLISRKPIPPVATLDSFDKSKLAFMSVSHGLDYVFFGFKNGELWAIRTKDGKRVQPEINVDATPIASSTSVQPTIAAQLNQKGTQLAALCSNGTIRFFDFPTMNPLDPLKPTSNGPVSVYSSSPNGRFMAGINTDFHVSVVDLDSREIYASWTLPSEDSPTSIAIENNGKRAAVGFASGSISVFQTNKD